MLCVMYILASGTCKVLYIVASFLSLPFLPPSLSPSPLPPPSFLTSSPLLSTSLPPTLLSLCPHFLLPQDKLFSPLLFHTGVVFPFQALLIQTYSSTNYNSVSLRIVVILLLQGKLGGSEWQTLPEKLCGSNWRNYKDLPVFGKIVDVYLDGATPFFHCNILHTIAFETHFHAFSVQEQANSHHLVLISELVDIHPYSLYRPPSTDRQRFSLLYILYILCWNQFYIEGGSMHLVTKITTEWLKP